MIFGLNVLAEQSASQHALAFAQTVIDSKHQLKLVFFHDNGVLCAQGAAAKQWSKLAEEHNFDLVLCINSAQHFNIDKHDLGNRFKLGSLIQLIDLECEVDRIISFKA